jgi:hypothetical protein
MWIPKTEQEIIEVVGSGSLEETISFDAKREVGKNSDLAKDVSAMANSAGGAIVFGIDEDENGRPTILAPVELSGLRERIDSIVRTSISEVPFTTITSIATETDKSKGYVIVLVPPSERAPHMVIAKGDRRYYGRGETGNYMLSEPEVTRLYERRVESRAAVAPLLEQAITEALTSAYEGYAHLHIVARPVLVGDNLITRAVGNDNGELPEKEAHSRLLNELVGAAMQDDIYKHSYVPDFSQGTWTLRPDGYINKMSQYVDGNYKTPSLFVRVNFDGSGALFCSRAAEPKEDGGVESKWFIPQIVAGNTTRFLALLGQLYEKAEYFSMVNIAIAVTNLRGSVSSSFFNRTQPSRFEENDFRKEIRTSSAELREKPREVAAKLVMPLIDAISQGFDKPFGDSQ